MARTECQCVLVKHVSHSSESPDCDVEKDVLTEKRKQDKRSFLSFWIQVIESLKYRWNDCEKWFGGCCVVACKIRVFLRCTSGLWKESGECPGDCELTLFHHESGHFIPQSMVIFLVTDEWRLSMAMYWTVIWMSFISDRPQLHQPQTVRIGKWSPNRGRGANWKQGTERGPRYELAWPSRNSLENL